MIGGGMYYLIAGNSLSTQEQVVKEQNAAQDAANAYREKQQQMMKQLEQ